MGILSRIRHKRPRHAAAIVKSLQDEPVVQEHWYSYKCRMCRNTFTGAWSPGDGPGIREGYCGLSRKALAVVEWLRWGSDWNNTYDHPRSHRPPLTVVHCCTDTQAGVADLVGAGCRAVVPEEVEGGMTDGLV